jgi:hypothetical protein
VRRHKRVECLAGCAHASERHAANSVHYGKCHASLQPSASVHCERMPATVVSSSPTKRPHLGHQPIVESPRSACFITASNIVESPTSAWCEEHDLATSSPLDEFVDCPQQPATGPGHRMLSTFLMRRRPGSPRSRTAVAPERPARTACVKAAPTVARLLGQSRSPRTCQIRPLLADPRERPRSPFRLGR